MASSSLTQISRYNYTYLTITIYSQIFFSFHPFVLFLFFLFLTNLFLVCRKKQDDGTQPHTYTYCTCGLSIHRKICQPLRQARQTSKQKKKPGRRQRKHSSDTPIATPVWADACYPPHTRNMLRTAESFLILSHTLSVYRSRISVVKMSQSNTHVRQISRLGPV